MEPKRPAVRFRPNNPENLPELTTARSVDTPVDLTKATYVPAGVTLMAGAGDHATYYVAESTDTLYSCGGNEAGDLGDMTTMGRPKRSITPMPVQGINDSHPVVSITASWADVGVLLSDGTFWTWGFNEWGQLGYSTSTSQCTAIGAKQSIPTGDCSLYPREVTSFPSGYTVVVPTNPRDNAVTMGGGGPGDGQTMAILTNGSNEYYCGWGNDTDGQLCNGSAISTNVPPTDFTSDLPAPTLTEVASGGTTGYLLDSSGNVWSCGANDKGQLGDGNREPLQPNPMRHTKPSQLLPARKQRTSRPLSGDHLSSYPVPASFEIVV